MKVNNYPVKLPSTGDRLFGSDSNGDQKQFDMSAVSSNVFQYQIGEHVADEGGVIFHRYLDGTTQNYLVVGLSNLSASQAWSNVASTAIGSTAQSTWDGLSNSNAIVGQSGQTSSAAKLCLDSTADSQTDWYLPSSDELLRVRINMLEVAQGLITAVGTLFGYSTYWSSTEFSSTNSMNVDFGTLAVNSASKGNSYSVRAIRKFSI